MPASFEQERIDGGVIVIRLGGSLTSDGLAQIEPRFKQATGGTGWRVVVDVERVSALTTPALAMLLSALRRANESNGRIVISGARGITRDIFTRCRLDVIFTMADSVPDAVKLLTGV